MIELKVTGMTCAHCVAAVGAALRTVDPAAVVDVDLAAGQVCVESAAPMERLAAAITGAGYTVAGARKAIRETKA